ncbi:MAG: glycosyltransferase family 2 protein [Prevotella sp.]|nr:glycosyltransferase family 2 protein [Prevotella sp.]
MKSLVIYAVTYNSYACLENYLASLDVSCKAVEENFICEVIVVDNSTQKEKITYFPTSYSLTILPMKENLGYFPSLHEVMKTHPPLQADYVIISNVDMLYEETTIPKLLQAEISERVGWIVPMIMSQTKGYNLNPQAAFRYSLKRLKLLRFAFKYPIVHYVYTKTLHKRKKFRSEQPKGCVYAGHGSFLILTKSYFEKAGVIAYPNFLYGEELYLAEENLRHELDVVYLPEIRVDDIGKVSTGQLKSKDYYNYNYTGLDYIIKNYYKVVDYGKVL